MKNIKLLFFASFLFIFIASCKKDDNGDGAIVRGIISLSVHAVHHSYDVGGIMIYLKYNSDSFPGPDSSLYEFSGRTDAEGKFTFEKLLPGQYFIYGTGYDSIWGSNVIGQLPVSLYSEYLNSNHADVTLQVSE